jgi:hypothetical protein
MILILDFYVDHHICTISYQMGFSQYLYNDHKIMIHSDLLYRKDHINMKCLIQPETNNLEQNY